MKFFNSISSSKPISVADAVKNAQNKPKARSLDEILNDTKAVKTASANGKTVTAATNNVTVQVKVAGMEEKIAGVTINPNTQKPYTQDELNAEKNQASVATPPTQVTAKTKKEKTPEERSKEYVKKVYTKDLEDEEPPVEDDDDDKKASTTQTLKMASKLDFREWNAEKVLGVWKEAGSMQGCMDSVKGLTNDPQTYCGLLKCAAQTAHKIVKTASAEKTKKEAAQNTPGFKKLSKLEGKERKRIYDYFAGIYGPGYAKAMLGE